jgi:hypothetical protein
MSLLLVAPLFHMKGLRWLKDKNKNNSGTSVSSINNTDRHDITEILVKVALNTMN